VEAPPTTPLTPDQMQDYMGPFPKVARGNGTIKVSSPPQTLSEMIKSIQHYNPKSNTKAPPNFGRLQGFKPMRIPVVFHRESQPSTQHKLDRQASQATASSAAVSMSYGQQWCRSAVQDAAGEFHVLKSIHGLDKYSPLITCHPKCCIVGSNPTCKSGPFDANVTHSSTPTVLGYTDKDNKYLPPYNWWADSAAKHLIDVVNKYYSGTGMSFYLQQASTGSHSLVGSCLLSQEDHSGLPASHAPCHPCCSDQHSISVQAGPCVLSVMLILVLN